MSVDREYAAWLRGRMEAYIWYCGDEVCECTEPRIEHITPNFSAGYPWVHRDQVWRGIFHSGASAEEFRFQCLELKDACKRERILFPYEYVYFTRPKIRRHPDEVVRLHYGPAHGRVVALTESAARDGYYLVPWRNPISLWMASDMPGEMEDSFKVVTYHRETLHIYDDIDHAIDIYDYWIADGEPLPKVGRRR